MKVKFFKENNKPKNEKYAQTLYWTITSTIRAYQQLKTGVVAAGSKASGSSKGGFFSFL